MGPLGEIHMWIPVGNADRLFIAAVGSLNTQVNK